MNNRTCDFCGLEGSKEPLELNENGCLELHKAARPHVLQLKLVVDPAVAIGDYSVGASSFNVCTDCIFRFLQEREQGGR